MLNTRGWPIPKIHPTIVAKIKPLDPLVHSEGYVLTPRLTQRPKGIPAIICVPNVDIRSPRLSSQVTKNAIAASNGAARSNAAHAQKNKCSAARLIYNNL